MDAKERRKVPAFTRILALMCVRQSRLETLHRGLSPIKMRPGTNLDLSAWLIGQGEPKFWVRHSLGFEADLPLTAGIGHRIGVKNGRSRGK